MKKFTPENITELGPNEIFVFGSNLAGIHGAGAARLAREKFGAVIGNPVGLQGSSYAIPTKDCSIETLNFVDIQKHVEEFLRFASLNTNLTFLVTKIGCGLAGFHPNEIAPLFRFVPKNVILPKEFASKEYHEEHEEN